MLKLQYLIPGLGDGAAAAAEHLPADREPDGEGEERAEVQLVAEQGQRAPGSQARVSVMLKSPI